MRRLRTLLLVPALLALVAGGAAAQGASRGLDRTYGGGGMTAVKVQLSEYELQGFEVAGDGHVYVLDGSLVLGFEPDGRVATGFGDGGRVTIAPADGEGAPADLTVDSQGRVLVAGTARSVNQTIYRPYVVRLLPDGSRDPSFGSDGEVDDLGLTAIAGDGGVEVDSIAVDAQDRPLLGGSVGAGLQSCGLGAGEGFDPFVARLTATGAVDTTFAGSGHAILKGPGRVEGVEETVDGNLGVFGDPCSVTMSRTEVFPPFFSLFTAAGEASSRAREVALRYSFVVPVIDPTGRVVQLASGSPPSDAFDAVTRYRPNGRLDRSFADRGRYLLRHRPHYADAIAVDARSRPIIAMASQRIALRRFLPNGRPDPSFGPNGRLTAPGKNPWDIGLDDSGRIYTLGHKQVHGGTILQIARFIPGR
jgi:uncharacterized delta-60 repeat protein